MQICFGKLRNLICGIWLNQNHIWKAWKFWILGICEFGNCGFPDLVKWANSEFRIVGMSELGISGKCEARILGEPQFGESSIGKSWIREILQHVQNCSNSSTAHFPQNTFSTSQILKNTSNSNFQLPVSLKFQLLNYPGFSFRLCFTILGTQTSRQKTYNHDGKCTIPTVSAPFRRNTHHPDG